MKFTVHKDFSELPASAWNALASSGISNTPFSRHEYLQQWWKTRGGGEWQDAELLLISASIGSEVRGIAPLFAANHDGRRSLLLVGSIEISDYLDLIVRPEEVEPFFTGLLDHLAGDSGTAGLPLDLYNVPGDSASLRALATEASRRSWHYQQDVFRPTPAIKLGVNFDTYLAGLDKKQRHEIRRKLRRAGEGPSPARFELIDSQGQVETATEDLLNLMMHDGDKALFLTTAMREHMRSLTRLAWEAGFLWLAFLNVDGVRAAAALNFDYDNRLWGYNSAVHRDFLELSPGWVLLAQQLEWACQHGRSEFDFMRGDESYKYRFGAVDRHVMRARLVPA